MAKVENYKHLIAWQRAMDLVEEVYRLTARYPSDERFGLISQTRRAAVSIPSNVAEGYARRTRGDYVHFLHMSRGSANEVETQLLLATRLGFVTANQARRAMDLTLEVQRIMKGLVKSLTPDKARSPHR